MKKWSQSCGLVLVLFCLSAVLTSVFAESRSSFIERLRSTKERMSSYMETQQFVGSADQPKIRTMSGKVYRLSSRPGPVKTTSRKSHQPIPQRFAPPRQVDNRSSLSTPKCQGGRGTCTVHAVIASLEGFDDTPSDLSEQDAHAMAINYVRDVKGRKRRVADNRGVFISDAVEALAREHVTLEQHDPYVNCPSRITVAHERRSERALKYPAAGVSKYILVGSEELTNPTWIAWHVMHGYNVLIDVGVAWDESLARSKGLVDVVLDKTSRPVEPSGYHSMLIVGYHLDREKVLVRNSWSTDWGFGGYCWMTFDYLKLYARQGAVILAADVSNSVVADAGMAAGGAGGSGGGGAGGLGGGGAGGGSLGLLGVTAAGSSRGGGGSFASGLAGADRQGRKPARQPIKSKPKPSPRNVKPALRPAESKQANAASKEKPAVERKAKASGLSSLRDGAEEAHKKARVFNLAARRAKAAAAKSGAAAARLAAAAAR